MTHSLCLTCCNLGYSLYNDSYSNIDPLSISMFSEVSVFPTVKFSGIFFMPLLTPSRVAIGMELNQVHMTYDGFRLMA